MQFDYTTVGHVTADVMEDGTRRVGGSAFYSALQAARLGLRTLILTRGAPEEIEGLLEPYRDELSLGILAAAETTTLQSTGAGAARRQRMLAWAGPIENDVVLDTAILHLAPVARETPTRWSGRADFVGLTAQGLVRAWTQPSGLIHAAPLERSLLPERCDAIVISEAERDSWEAMPDGRQVSAPAGDALLAVTAQADPTAIRLPGGEMLSAPVPPIEVLRDDIGAGDVFAAALFIALAEGQPALEAAAFANAAAAVRISGAGAGAIGGRDAIASRLSAVS